MRKFVVLVLFAFVPMFVSAQNYQAHPEMALSDAGKLFKEGKYEDAINKYKIYQALSGRSMTKEINLAETCISHRKQSQTFLDGKDYTNALKSSLSLYAVNKADEDNITLMKKALAAFVAQKKAVSNSDLLNRLRTAYDDFSKSSARKSMIPDMQKALALLGDKDLAYNVANELRQSNSTDAVDYYIIASNGVGTQAAESCLYLGDYYTGKSKYEEANKYYSKGIEKGSGDCAYKLGRYYESRISYSTSNRQLALDNYETAQKLGNTLAASRIAELKKVAASTPAVTNTKTRPKKSLEDVFDPSECIFYGLEYSYQKQSYAYSFVQHILYLSLGFTYGKYKDGVDTYAYFDKETGANFQVTQYTPRYYFLVSPGVYLKYLSLDLGLGSVGCDSKVTNVAYSSSSSITPDSFEGKPLGEKLSDKNTCFVVQPRLSLYYPFEDFPLRVGVHVGYNYIPRLPELSGIVAGAGIAINVYDL